MSVQRLRGPHDIGMKAEQIVIIEEHKVVIIRLLEIDVLTSHALHVKGGSHRWSVRFALTVLSLCSTSSKWRAHGHER